MSAKFTALNRELILLIQEKMKKLSKLDLFEGNRLEGLVNCSGGIYFDTFHEGQQYDVFHDKFTKKDTMTVGDQTYSGDQYFI